VGSIELTKQFNVPVFSFKAKSVIIIWKEIGAMLLTGGVLVSLNTLGNYGGMAGGNQPSLFLRKKPLQGEPKIDIPLYTWMER
jgi:hypothetical protein